MVSSKSDWIELFNALSMETLVADCTYVAMLTMQKNLFINVCVRKHNFTSSAPYKGSGPAYVYVITLHRVAGEPWTCRL